MDVCSGGDNADVCLWYGNGRKEEQMVKVGIVCIVIATMASNNSNSN